MYRVLLSCLQGLFPPHNLWEFHFPTLWACYMIGCLFPSHVLYFPHFMSTLCWFFYLVCSPCLHNSAHVMWWHSVSFSNNSLCADNSRTPNSSYGTDQFFDLILSLGWGQSFQIFSLDRGDFQYMYITRAQNWDGASVGCPKSPKIIKWGKSPLYYCAWIIEYIHNIFQKLYPLSDEVGMLRIIMVVGIPPLCVVLWSSTTAAWICAIWCQTEWKRGSLDWWCAIQEAGSVEVNW